MVGFSPGVVLSVLVWSGLVEMLKMCFRSFARRHLSRFFLSLSFFIQDFSNPDFYDFDRLAKNFVVPGRMCICSDML